MSSPSSSGPRALTLGLLFVVALVVRAAFVLLEPATRLVADERVWVAIGRQLASPEVAFNPLRYAQIFHPPLYAYMVGLLEHLSGTLEAVKWAQVILGALLAPLVARVGAAAFCTRVGVLAGSAAAVYPELVWYCAHFWSEILFLALLWGAIERLVASEEREAPGPAVAAGLLCGLAALVRETALVAAPLAAVWLFVGRVKGRRRALLFLAACALTVLPWTVRNWRAEGAFVPVATRASFNLWLGNTELPWDEVYRQHEATPGGPVARSRRATREAVRAVWERQPAWALEKLAHEIPALLGVNDHVVIHVQRGAYDLSLPARWLVLVVMALPFVLTAMLAAPSIAPVARSRYGTLLVGFALFYVSIHVVAFGSTRFRLPLLPVLFLLAARTLDLGWAATWRAQGGLQRTASAILCAVLAVAIGVNAAETLRHPAFRPSKVPATGTALAPASVEAPAVPTVRNLVLVSLDTFRADRLGGHREGVPLTPRLDAFAARSTRFTDCRAVSGHTLASHKALLSGRLPAAFLRAYSEGRPPDAEPEPVDAYYRAAFLDWPFPSVARLLKNAGYATAGFADGGYVSRRFGFADGFDIYGGRQRGLGKQCAAARRWLESAGPKPFFLFVHTYDVHCPYDPPARYLRLFGHRCTGRLEFDGTCGKPYFNGLELTPAEREHLAVHYDAGVRHADDALGEFLDWLESAGRLADTALVITSDHGESLGERSFVGHGGLHDNQLHVPLVVWVPDQAPAVVDDPVSGVDVAATILDLLLGQAPAGLDGRSLRGTMAGTARGEPRLRVASVTVNEGRESVSRLRKTAVLEPAGPKLIFDPDSGAGELFDLARDPEEVRNLFGAPDSHPRHAALLDEVKRAEPGPLKGVHEGGSGAGYDDLAPETLEALRALGYVE